MMAVTRPLLSTESASLGGRDHKGGAAHFDDGDLLMRRHAAGIGCERQPPFVEQSGMTGVVLVPDRFEGQRRLSDQIVRIPGHGQLGAEVSLGLE